MNEKLTSLEQLRMTAERSAQLSAQVALAAAEAVEEMQEGLVGKQDKLTGTQGQVVGFDGEGNAVAQDAATSGVGRSMAGQTVESEIDTTVTAGEGAEIFNDYRDRTFHLIDANSGNIASGDYSHAEGSTTTASGNCSHAEGYRTAARAPYSHAEGYSTGASGDCSHAEGDSTTASGNYSHASGYHTFAEYLAETAIGRYNVHKSPSDNVTIGDLFVVGKGARFSEQANAFRVDHAGVYGTGAFNASGADYAELFEWQDGNPDSEDRAGLFVTLDGERIRIAGPDDDYILGIVSATPSVVGDVYDDQWQGMEVRDVFGRTVMEMRDFPAEIGLDGEEITPERQELAPKLNPDYDHTIKYQPRTQRPEWSAVGLLGKLVAVDDGSCQVNGWAAVGEGGQATASAARTRYRVMARLDDTHIRLMIL